jgi:hypothetical protein
MFVVLQLEVFIKIRFYYNVVYGHRGAFKPKVLVVCSSPTFPWTPWSSHVPIIRCRAAGWCRPRHVPSQVPIIRSPTARWCCPRWHQNLRCYTIAHKIHLPIIQSHITSRHRRPRIHKAFQYLPKSSKLRPTRDLCKVPQR